MSASTASTQPTLSAEAYYTREIDRLNLEADSIRTTAKNASTTFFALGRYTGEQESEWEATLDECEEAIEHIDKELKKLYVAKDSHAAKLDHVQRAISRRSTELPKSHASVRDLS